MATRHPATTIADGRAHAFPAFLNGGVGQTDDHDARNATTNVDFDFDQYAVEPNDCAAIDLCQHLTAHSRT
jgi:hypothetical protein